MYRFGAFDLDVEAGLLTRAGRRVRLPRQSFVLLRLLVERPGQVVTREALAAVLWPEGLHVDFDHGINNAAARLRAALGDPAATPRFIETLPRVGYRFLAPVHVVSTAPSVEAAQPLPRRRWWPVAVSLAATFAMGVGTGVLLVRPDVGEAGVHAERSLAYTRLVLDGDVPSGLVQTSASEAAAKALDLDSGLADAHLARGYVQLWGRWDWPAAEHSFRTAVSLAPQSARVRLGYAFWLAGSGRHDAALEQLSLAPGLNQSSHDVVYDAALVSFVAGDVDAAIDRLDALVKRRPDDARARELLSEVLSSVGRNTEAARHFHHFLVLVDVAEHDAADAARALASGGMVGLVRRNLERPSGKPADRYGVPFKVASNHAVVGNVDAALEWLERALQQRDSRLLLVNVHPRFAAVRNDPRFRPLLRAAGLPT